MNKLVLFLTCASLAVGSAAAKDEPNPAEQFYKAGKEKFEQYDDNQAKLYLPSNNNPVDTLSMCIALLEGYENYVKALPLDTIIQTNKDGSPKIDKKTGKPKTKTKYSKDIVNTIAGHHNDFSIAGSVFYGKEDYASAAKAWTIYASLPSAEFLGDKKPELADSTIAETFYNVGVSQYFAKNYEESIDALGKAKKLGYANDNFRTILQLSVSGAVDKYMVAKDYAKCDEILDGAIANFPNEAMFIMFKGIVIETETEDIEQAISYYKESAEKDPTLADAQYHVGRYYNNKAVTLMNAEENLNLTDEELGKIIDPICLQAKPYLEKAVELNASNSEAKRMLDWVNSRLNK